MNARGKFAPVLLFGLAILAAACHSDGGATWAGRQLHIHNWQDYIAPTTIPDFEKEFGVTVTLTTFQTEDELTSAIASDPAQYDLFVGSDSLISEMSQLRLVAELDKQNIPNLVNIDPRFFDLPTDPGSKHGVPYDWGTTGILYNKNCVQPKDQSWALLRDPSLAGKVAMDTDPTVVIGSTLQSLGYSLNSSDPTQISQAVATLKTQLANGQLELKSISDDARAMIKTGALCATQAYNGDAAHDMTENADLAFFVPREGSDLYVDEMAIPRDARNKDVAELFINYVLRPEVQAAINDYTGYASPNRAAIDKGFISQASISDRTIYPDTANLEPWVTFDGGRRSLWNEAWADVVSAEPPSTVADPRANQ